MTRIAASHDIRQVVVSHRTVFIVPTNSLGRRANRLRLERFRTPGTFRPNGGVARPVGGSAPARGLTPIPFSRQPGVQLIPERTFGLPAAIHGACRRYHQLREGHQQIFGNNEAAHRQPRRNQEYDGRS